VTTAQAPDPLAVRCPYCAMPPGELCVTRTGAIRLPHAARRRLALTLAAHSDPVLDTVMVPGGPCGICGTPGLTRRHRVIDAMAERMAAGELPGEVAEDYGVPLAAALTVQAWAARWPGVA
jgi:hypothetical protein